MRRRVAHSAFAAAAVICCAGAIHGALRLEQANRVNDAIARATIGAADPILPEGRFARAAALARAGEADAAIRAYKELVQGARPDLQVAALYNLGNLYMREAAGKEQEDPDPARTLPLLELAKQSYRRALRIDPYEWNARFNLERALRLAPEMDEAATDDDVEAPEQHVRSTVRGAKMDLP